MAILRNRALKQQYPPGYAALVQLAKETTGILEELADHWSLHPLDGGGEKKETMNQRIEQVLNTTKKLGL